jgi:hypothetical protein
VKDSRIEKRKRKGGSERRVLFEERGIVGGLSMDWNWNRVCISWLRSGLGVFLE